MQQQSKIVRYISEISPKERERFQQFVRSPYFNQHEKTQELLDIILEYIERPNGQMEKEPLFARLFPGEALDEQRLHNVMSYLKKLYHRFLAIQYIDSLPLREQLFTLESAYEVNQFDLLTNRARQLEKSIEQYPYHDGDYHFVNYRFNSLLGFYSGGYVDRSKSDSFQKMLYHLDRYYIVEKLRNCCHLTANMMLFNTRYDFGFMEELLAYVQRHLPSFENDASILLYYTILMTMREENNPEHYERLKLILNTKMNTINADEGYDLYNFASNYCIRQIKMGHSKYQRELFELYQQGLRAELLLNNGLISEWDYKNIITLGCSLKEFAWTEQFIEEYRSKLLASRRENAYNYNLANFYYNRQLYNDALEVLRNVQFTDVFYHLNTTFLQLRIYYDLKDTEAFLGLIETFRIYVIRNRKMTTAEKKSYTNLLRFAKSLAMLKHHADTYPRKVLQEKLAVLHQKIAAADNVINKQWLLEESRKV
ncbi:MAG TPA: hypothetical protein PKC76_08530 [Saprospiraceae bacterium]|nr:hypothetical protein [Saprospiraceae bacterium]HMP24163.1 hypothetical protein [Saprospiraceae bacterium]